MNEKLFDFLKELQENKNLRNLSEEATKQTVILKIFSLLGWDPFNAYEVMPEYSVGASRVDYSLRINNSNKVFIEVKKINEDLEKHQEQILNYSFKEGVKMAVLTNGISWWFYLPLSEGSWEQRKFYTIEIYDQDAENITTKFMDFLSKENINSGKYVKNAEEVIKSKQKQYLIDKNLPKAWDKIIKEPDDLLIELLAETTEKLCGYKPDTKTIVKFIHNITKSPYYEPSVAKVTRITQGTNDDYKGKSINSFKLEGKIYNANTWKEMLIKVCSIMYKKHKKDFKKIFSLRGDKRPYFSINPKDLRLPGKIEGTNIYVETNINANFAVRLTRKVIAMFNGNEKDFRIYTN